MGLREMRHAKSDADKAARGTLARHKKHSELGRAKRAVDNVLMFPQLKITPDPSVDLLPGGPGEKAYESWCVALLKSNLLTKTTVGIVENLALTEDKLKMRFDAGKEAPDKSLEIRRGCFLQLGALNVDSSIVPDQGKENPFARNGYPAKLGRSAKDHKWRG